MKVGIITFYHNSLNYGGNLQAYALTKYLNKNNIYAEQIPYYKSVSKKEKIDSLTSKGLFYLLRKIIFKVTKLPLQNEFKEIISKRQIAFNEFNQNKIPHNDVVFNSDTIENSLQEYDIFITGSDQVWNLNWYDSTYFLDFVPSNKKKLSYAASFSMNDFSDEHKIILKKSLKDYYAISVREESAVQLLENLIPQKSMLVVDPTLLLKQSEWEEVSFERFIHEKYIFCYFLGINARAKKVAEAYAKKENYKLVSIVYASGNFVVQNSKFGDIQLVDVSPEKFLSLIKYAEYIFTDSFHAVVFSFIFQKQFLVFNRDKKGSMNSRITSLTDMFDLQERFCATKEQETLEYIETLQEIDYTVDFPKFEEWREKSYEFIRNNILEQ